MEEETIYIKGEGRKVVCLLIDLLYVSGLSTNSSYMIYFSKTQRRTHISKQLPSAKNKEESDL